jgi:hypothetical protein
VKRFLRLTIIALCSIAVLVLTATFSASRYYTSQRGDGCASCHEMASYVSAVHTSHHRNVGCMECHSASLSTKLRHIRVHLSGNLPETIRLRDHDVLEMMENCQKCHQQEYATWHAGPHSATYSQIFLDSTHNSTRPLMEDCLRCHGMHFNGAIRDLVQPVKMQGPWRLIRGELANEPVMPCQTCHWAHREGELATKPKQRITAAGKVTSNAAAFFDRRERIHFASASLAIPRLFEKDRVVRVSSDQRQGICYQCHAPRQPETGTEAALHSWGPQVGSGDDRTPIGVHEGLSCISCHSGHNESAAASCTSCHPEMSHCSLDVRKMDTTYSNRSSTHDIHWVRCVDCHEHGVPKIKRSLTSSGHTSIGSLNADSN